MPGLTGCGEARAAAGRLVRSLYLPLRGGAYARYPLRPEDRVFEGRPDGELTGDCINGWYLSTDIGCAYMCLDGLSRAYRDLDIPELKDLLEEMIEASPLLISWAFPCRSHATLSGIRGILCFYEALGDARYLEMAKRLFSLYERAGYDGELRQPKLVPPPALDGTLRHCGFFYGRYGLVPVYGEYHLF